MKNLTTQMTIHPFSTVFEIGFSESRVEKLEQLAAKHKESGSWLGVFSWPNGNWCVVVMNAQPSSASALTNKVKAELYDRAALMATEEIFPLLDLRAQA
ncbi:hypothetical protein [Pseudomonas syringae]|uniref:Uncharacterized protein n=1 Tax=Pseudomonas syringae TaxID=317 RepID=A0A085V6W1_PSESX|nr:hypothetical protein [Pseudomonas syringae]KFE51174.1 hypothetical protein IV02_13250 [Pseudomonas syringae]